MVLNAAKLLTFAAKVTRCCHVMPMVNNDSAKDTMVMIMAYNDMNNALIDNPLSMPAIFADEMFWH